MHLLLRSDLNGEEEKKSVKLVTVWDNSKHRLPELNRRYYYRRELKRHSPN